MTGYLVPKSKVDDFYRPIDNFIERWMQAEEAQILGNMSAAASHWAWIATHAKDEMVRLLSDGKTRYFDEIAEILKLDIRLVVKGFKELNEEGRLFIDENSI